jgi:CspA family cold shock protein
MVAFRSRRATETHRGRTVVIRSTLIDHSYDRVTNNYWMTGIVRYFDDKDGVGVIDSPDTPGGCWCHYSNIDIPGRKTLHAGQSVRFTFEGEIEQDGFVYRALSVQPSI